MKLLLKAAGAIWRHPKRTIALGIGWIVTGETVIDIYNGDGPRRTYNDLRALSNARTKQFGAPNSARADAVSTLKTHLFVDSLWPGYIFFAELLRRHGRPQAR